jgi:hypothetical protein
VSRVFYRIIRGPIPTLDDLRSAKDLGKPLPRPLFHREWADAISVYDSLEYAVRKASELRFMVGDHVISLTIPDGSLLEVRQTTRDRHHYSIYASPEELISLVSGTSIPCRGGA